jgi:hypothetical protein
VDTKALAPELEHETPSAHLNHVVERGTSPVRRRFLPRHERARVDVCGQHKHNKAEALLFVVDATA